MYTLAYTMHQGKVCRQQQDCLLIHKKIYQEKSLPITTSPFNKEELLLAVADGLTSSGGNPRLAPQKASRVALEELVKTWRQNPEWFQDGFIANRHLRRVQAQLAQRLSHSPITHGAATTLVVVHLKNDHCALLNTGDSRIYLANAAGIWQRLSKDHTLLQGLIDQGKALADQEYGSIYGMLEHALTADFDETDFAIHRQTTILEQGATLVLCSDGIHDQLGEQQMWDAFDPARDVATQTRMWRDAVWKNGAKDNFSLIVLRRENV